MHWVIPETGEQGFGSGTVNGSNVTIDYTYVAPLGFTLADGSTSASCTATGTIQERQSLSVSTSCTTSLGGTFTNTGSLAYDDLYERDSSLAVIAGNWDDFGVVLTVSGNGEIFEQDPFTGCVVNGQVSIIDPQYNAYEVVITYSNCTGNFAIINGSTFSGLAILDNTVVPEQATFGLVGEVGGVTYSFVSTVLRM
jgi:hypothetical protein